MRDRLIELLCNVKCEGEECFGNCPHRIGQKCNKVQRLEMCSVFAIADHLLAEGVIVPPVKVGTTLYFLYNSPYADKPDLIPRIYKTEKWYFEVDKTGVVINTSDIHSFNKKYDYYLGETVFLTREEAEKALERSENGKS